jgi:hypothetical protein
MLIFSHLYEAFWNEKLFFFFFFSFHFFYWSWQGETQNGKAPWQGVCEAFFLSFFLFSFHAHMLTHWFMKRVYFTGAR